MFKAASSVEDRQSGFVGILFPFIDWSYGISLDVYFGGQFRIKKSFAQKICEPEKRKVVIYETRLSGFLVLRMAASRGDDIRAPSSSVRVQGGYHRQSWRVPGPAQGACER